MRRWMVIPLVCSALWDCAVVPDDTIIPPRPSAAPVVARSDMETFALDSVFLGDVDRNGNPVGHTAVAGCNPSVGSTAWKAYGYDLDGRITDKTSTDVCSLTLGAPPSNQVDGSGGIDNAWGQILLPIGENIPNVPMPSAYETGLVQSGRWTLQLQLLGLPLDGADAVGIGARIFVSGPYDRGTPAFDSSTDWPVLASSMAEFASYEDAYVSHGTFVSGSPSDRPIVLPLVFAGAPLTLRVRRAVVTFERDPSDPTRLMNGTIAGVLDTTELTVSVRRAIGFVTTGLCGAAFDGIAQQIAMTQDILSDATNHAGVPCDAISIGIGFTARRVANPTKTASDPIVPADPCE